MAEIVGALRARLRPDGLLGASGVNLAMQLGSTALALVTGIAMSRILGAAELGVYAFAFAAANVLGVVGRLGLENLLVREVSGGVERRSWGLVRGLVGFASGTSFVGCLVLGVVAAVVTWAFGAPSTAAAMAWAVPMLLATSGLALRAAALRGLGAVVLSQVPVLVVRPALFLALILALALVEAPSAWQAVAAHALAFGVAWALVGALWVRRRPAELAAAAPEHDTRAWLASSTSLLVIGVLGVLNSQADLLLLKGLASDASTGIYSVATQLGRTTAMVLAVANGVIAPRFAALHVRGDRAGLRELATSSAAAITALTLPGVALLAIAGPSLLGLYGAEFVAAYPAMLVLMAGQLVNAVAGSVGNLLLMTGHEREVGVATVVTVTLNIALNVLLVPRLDVLGAAIGSAAAVTVWNVALAWRVRRLLGIDSTAVAWVLERLRGRRLGGRRRSA